MTKFILFTTLIFCASFTSFSQIDKAELKKWKKRLKSVSAEEYKRLVEDSDALSQQLSNARAEIDDFDSKIEKKNKVVGGLETEIESLKAKVYEAQNAIPVAVDNYQSPPPASDCYDGIDQSGVIFKVQIGAFTNRDIIDYDVNQKNISIIDEDGYKKFILGSFRDYWVADDLKKQLHNIGVKDAFVVPYKDSERVSIIDVVDYIDN